MRSGGEARDLLSGRFSLCAVGESRGGMLKGLIIYEVIGGLIFGTPFRSCERLRRGAERCTKNSPKGRGPSVRGNTLSSPPDFLPRRKFARRRKGRKNSARNFFPQEPPIRGDVRCDGRERRRHLRADSHHCIHHQRPASRASGRLFHGLALWGNGREADSALCGGMGHSQKRESVCAQEFVCLHPHTGRG